MDSNATIRFHGGLETVVDSIGQLANQTLTIVTLHEQPFIMLKDPKDMSDVQDHEIEGQTALGWNLRYDFRDNIKENTSN